MGTKATIVPYEAYLFIEAYPDIKKLGKPLAGAISVSPKNLRAFLAGLDRATTTFIQSRIGELTPSASTSKNHFLAIHKAAKRLQSLLKAPEERKEAMPIDSFKIAAFGLFGKRQSIEGAGHVARATDRALTSIWQELKQVTVITDHALSKPVGKEGGGIKAKKVSALQQYTNEVVSLYFRYRGKSISAPAMGGGNLIQFVRRCDALLQSQERPGLEFVKSVPRRDRAQFIRNRIRNTPAYKELKAKKKS